MCEIKNLAEQVIRHISPPTRAQIKIWVEILDEEKDETWLF